MTSASENGLPKPRRARWQPLRSGLINLFRYDNEELWFEDGRLLLRGYNGTGKSRVLALQLPFLLDGEVSPHRLEPDGDPAKRIEWNLLMGKYDERRGYTWLELGRLTDDADEEGPGHERYLTLGCGLHAVKGRGLANRWFFLTERRVGVDLFLLGRAQEVLTRPHLAEALGEAGEIFTTARDYRAAVDRRLFQLGLQRYEALVDLLIQLRQPQLSRKLDAGKLSAALSEALPPLDRDILADIAEAFRSLEADRETLETLRSAAGGAEAFLRGYRRYAQIGARRRAEGVRTSHSAYEHARRRLRAAAERQQVATAGLDDADAELEQLQDAETRATAEVRTLERRPEMRDKQTLDAARQRAQDHLRAARRAGEELERATEQRGHARRQAEDERHAADQRHHEAERALVTTATASKAAGCATEHHQQLDDLGPAQIVATSLAATEQSLDELAGRKQRGVRHVRALQQQVATVEQRLTAAKELHTARAAELDEATERHQDAHRAVGAAQDRLLADYRQWRTEAIELAPPSAGELVEALTLWRREAEGPAPLSAAVRAAELTATRALETARAGQQIQQRRIEQELGELSTERAALQAGAHRPPAAPLHRAEGVREGRRGGPLWQLCDFAANITEIERAGLEAALEASGLLDAWITPEGDMLAAEDLDTVLVAGRSNPPSSGSALDALLLPDPTVVETSTVAADTVTKVLQHIGLGSGTSELWVQTDGRFQAGPLHGRADKPAAQHIGQSAREAERQRRLAEVEAAIAQTREQADAVAAALAELARRRDRVREEVARAPTEDPLRRAAADLAAATTFVDRARQLLVAAEAEVQRRRSELQGVIEERDAAARDLGIADHLDDLPGLEQSLAEYRRLLAALWPSLRALRSALAAAEAADERFQAAAREEARRNRASDEALDRQRASAAECETLEQTLGSGVREILERLEQARSRYAKIREQQQLTRERREGCLAEQARADARMEAEHGNVEREASLRQNAIGSLQRLIETGLLSVAEPALPVSDEDRSAERSVKRSVEICRALEARLSEVESDDGRWQRQQRDVHNQFQRLQETLAPHGYPPVLTVEDDLFVVTAPFQGQHQTLDVFRSSLHDEVSMRDRVLAEREREVIENHLIGEAALHLHQRLRDAEELVLRINQQIESRPTSTGMILRFRWQPLGQEFMGLDGARRLLMSEHGLWSAQDRKAVGDFLQGLIDERRREDDTGTWQEHLRDALDYRRWHEFGVERRQDDRWRRLTRRTHGTGSGGEKALALTVPQFAAAAAHYDTADKRAPRLILLDEAFVGIDKDMRAKCMGLLHAFDLDFVMTSEREWACYPTLPGVAIYQLATRPNIDAVAMSRWLWNGRERQRDNPVLPPASLPPKALDERQADLFSEAE